MLTIFGNQSMPISIQKNNLSKKPTKKRLSFRWFFILVIATSLSVGGFGIWSVERQMKENLAAQLRLVLSGNLESLRVWAEGTKLDAEVLVRQPEIHKSLISLLEMAQSKAMNPEVLRHSIQLTWLRENLGIACQKCGFIRVYHF